MANKTKSFNPPANTNIFEREQEFAKPYRGSSPEQLELMQKGDLQGVIESLSDPQRIFIEEYLKDFNASAAVRRSPYNLKPGTENRMASQLLRTRHVRYCIDGLLAQRKDRVSVTAADVINKILTTIERVETKEKYDPNAVLRAAELLGRHLGMFKDRQEISGPDGGPIETKDIDDAAGEFDVLINRLKERADGEESGTNPGLTAEG